jgi:hypothetical protein
VQKEECEQEALLPPTEVDRNAVVAAHLERAE